MTCAVRTPEILVPPVPNVPLTTGIVTLIRVTETVITGTPGLPTDEASRQNRKATLSAGIAAVATGVVELSAGILSLALDRPTRSNSMGTLESGSAVLARAMRSEAAGSLVLTGPNSSRRMGGSPRQPGSSPGRAKGGHTRLSRQRAASWGESFTLLATSL